MLQDHLYEWFLHLANDSGVQIARLQQRSLLQEGPKFASDHLLEREVRQVRSANGTVTDVWFAGMKMTSERKLERELKKRYGKR